MSHTFDTVDEKVAETEFFLRKMTETYMDMFEFKCFFSAFLSASRTTTLAIQQFNDIPGFQEWYEPQRNRLKDDRLAKFFLDTRNEHIHGGPHPVSGGSFIKGKAKYYFSRPLNKRDQLQDDVVSVSLKYFITLLDVVYDCYVKLGVHIDPQQHYTKEHFSSMGKTIENAEIEVWGWIMSSLIDEGHNEDDRWHELRSRVGECQINHLFYSYLGKTTPQPLEPEHYRDFEYTPEEKGWTHIPAGFDSIEAYLKYMRVIIK